jgi:hypothetical protein
MGAGEAAIDVFVSVGTGLSPTQEAFVSAVEARLRSEGFTPHTLNRNDWSTLAPLKAVIELMGRCQGAVILGLERYHFPRGTVRRGAAEEKKLGATAFATAWNQIEAAMAYLRGRPLLVLVDEGVKTDGLLEPGNDWFVATIKIEVDALHSEQFLGLLRDWCARVRAAAPAPQGGDLGEVSKLSLREFVAKLRVGEAWTAVALAAGILAGAFSLGVKLAPLFDKPTVSAPAGRSQTPANP